MGVLVNRYNNKIGLKLALFTDNFAAAQNQLNKKSTEKNLQNRKLVFKIVVYPSNYNSSEYHVNKLINRVFRFGLRGNENFQTCNLIMEIHWIDAALSR